MRSFAGNRPKHTLGHEETHKLLGKNSRSGERYRLTKIAATFLGVCSWGNSDETLNCLAISAAIHYGRRCKLPNSLSR